MRDNYNAYKMLETAVECAFKYMRIITADNKHVILENELTKNRYKMRWAVDGNNVSFFSAEPYEFDPSNALFDTSRSIVEALDNDDDRLLSIYLESYIYTLQLESKFNSIDIPSVVLERSHDPFIVLLREGAYNYSIGSNVDDDISYEQISEAKQLVDGRTLALTIPESSIARKLVHAYYRFGSDKAARKFLEEYERELALLTSDELEGIVNNILEATNIDGDPKEFVDKLTSLGLRSLTEQEANDIDQIWQRMGVYGTYTQRERDEIVGFARNIRKHLDGTMLANFVDPMFLRRIESLVSEYDSAISDAAKNGIVTKIIIELSKLWGDKEYED